MSEQGWQEVPAGVEEMPVGAELAVVLAGIDPARVSPRDTVRVVAAHRRLLSWQESRFSEAVLQSALADPAVSGGRTEVVGAHGADELREVLHESHWAIEKILARAEFAERWPPVARAWQEASLDQERVRVFVSTTAALSAEHTGQVVDIVVPEAGGLTLKGLYERIEQVARDLDPEWAKKRYERHKAQRRVRARRTEAGTANLSGLDLGLDDTALAERNISVLAARAKALGHPGLMDTIEADVYVALLKPRPPWWSDDDVVAAVVAGADPADPVDPQGMPDPDQAPPDGPVLGDTEASCADDEATADPVGADPVSDAGPATDARPPTNAAPDPSGAAAAGTDPAASTDPAAGTDSATGTGAGRRPVRSRRWPRRSKLALRVGLPTLLGLDRHTARLPGYGIVHAELAVTLSRDWADADWRIAFGDRTGALSTVLTTRHRPDGWATVPINPDGTPTDPRIYHPATGTPDGAPAPPRPLVVLHITDEEFDQLDPAQFPRWTALLTDLARQRTFWSRTAGQHASVNDPGLDPGLDLGAGLADRFEGAPVDLGGLLADLITNPAARFPSAAQRRWLEERNQTCTFPACGADAIYCDIDHTRPASGGGPTLSWNLGPACPHDNKLKEQPGWWVEQTRPGHFVWHSNTGHAYPSGPTSPVPDHPAFRLFSVPSSTVPVEYAGNHAAWTNEPYPTPETPPETPPGSPDGPPPDSDRRPPGRPTTPPAPDDDPPPF